MAKSIYYFSLGLKKELTQNRTKKVSKELMHTPLPIAHLQRPRMHQKIVFFLLPAGSA